MKKLIALLLVALNSLCLVGCGETANKSKIEETIATENTNSFQQATTNMSYTFDNMEPYIQYLVNSEDFGSDYAKTRKFTNLNNVSIGDIVGTIDYSGIGIGVTDKMTWITNSSGYIVEQFDNIRNTIIDYYDVSIDDKSYLEDRHSKFYNDFLTIECDISEEGVISISWDYNDSKYLKEQIAAQSVIQDLKKHLKNPESLQIHEVSYSKNAYCSECNDAIKICIGYSAQNGFGGYNRDY